MSQEDKIWDKIFCIFSVWFWFLIIMHFDLRLWPVKYPPFCNLLVFLMATQVTKFRKCLVSICEWSMLTLSFRVFKPLWVYVYLINFGTSIFKPLTIFCFFNQAFLVLLGFFILLYFAMCCWMHISLWLLCVLCQCYPFIL